MTRAVLMGDPAHFHIRGGANPHTRDRWGRRKTVDPARARAQWDHLARLLTERGAKIFVIPPVVGCPGMVFPANAGFLREADAPKPPSEKTFVLSTTLPTRAAEKAILRRFIAGLGMTTVDFPVRFEGEADLFPAGEVFLFTSGVLERQRFVPRLGWPPYRRVYGFRSDPAGLRGVEGLVDRPVLPLTLVRETHYHGDTCLCAFGPNREFLMVYPPALDARSLDLLKERFRERLLPLSEEDGEGFSANAFQLEGRPPCLFMPHTASPRLRDQIRERGVEVVTADVSEFMTKGGGSVKCMIGDLGVWSAA